MLLFYLHYSPHYFGTHFKSNTMDIIEVKELVKAIGRIHSNPTFFSNENDEDYQLIQKLLTPQPKPVIVVTLPSRTTYADADNARHVLTGILGEDYYVLVIHLRQGGETSDFKILSVKDIDDTKYEELKQIIESNTKNTSSNEVKS